MESSFVLFLRLLVVEAGVIVVGVAAVLEVAMAMSLDGRCAVRKQHKASVWARIENTGGMTCGLD